MPRFTSMFDISPLPLVNHMTIYVWNECAQQFPEGEDQVQRGDTLKIRYTVHQTLGDNTKGDEEKHVGIGARLFGAGIGEGGFNPKGDPVICTVGWKIM